MLVDGGRTATATAVSASGALDPWITPTPKILVLTLLNTELPLAWSAMTPNGAAIGGALDRLRERASGDLAAVTRELTALDDVGLSRALDAVAGEIHASSVQLAALDGQGMADLVRGEIASRGTPEVVKASPAGLTWGADRRVWGRYQAQRTTFAAGATHGADAEISGFALGTDWTLGDHWLVGIGGGYTRGDLAVDGLADSSDYTAPRAFGYLGYAARRWVAHVGTSLAHTGTTSGRTLLFTARLPDAFGGAPVFGGVDREATSTPSGVATDLWGDWALPVRLGAWMTHPSVGVRYARYANHAWTESGADALSLSAADRTIVSAQTDLGLHVMRAIGRFRPNVSATYRRELSNGRTTTAFQLSNLADGNFVVDGLPFARDNLTARTGFTFTLEPFDLSLLLEVRRAPGQTNHAIQFGVRF